MEARIRTATWLLNEEADGQDCSDWAVPMPGLLRRPKPQPIVVTACPNRDWTNPNRFSDPLNRASRLPASSGLCVPGRPNKAYTWYLDNHLPCRPTGRSRTSWEDQVHCLFGVKNSDRQGIRYSKTWERGHLHPTARLAADARCSVLETGSTGRLSPHVFSSQRGLTAYQQAVASRVDDDCAVSQRCSPCSSHHSSPAVSRRSSPFESQRSSPSASQQRTLARLSPHCHPAFSSTGQFQTSLLSQWASGTSASCRSACSSGTSSFGSETDDDFFYISCQQLTSGLADLSVTSSSRRRAYDDNELDRSFTYRAKGDDAAEGDDDFDGCSDDALSDEVFLDSPQYSNSLFLSTSLAALTRADEKVIDDSVQAAANTKDQVTGASDTAGESHPAVESLGKDSLQNKLRQTWRHRRHRMLGHRSAGLKAVSSERPSGGSPQTQLNLVLSKATPPSLKSEAASPKPSSPSLEDKSLADGSEAKPCYYYVISPTDDDSMPDVIAVRKSSVELIRWQNSLRRRRRRQAKRQDACRNVKDWQISATV